MSLFQSHTWFGRLESFLGNVVDNMVKQYAGTGKSDKFQEELKESEASNDRLAENAYERNVDFYERFESVSAQVRQYKEAGLNPALMYGNGASVSASNVAPSGSASAGGGSSLDLLGTLLSSMLKFKQLEQDKILRGREQIYEDRRIKQQERYNDILEGLYGTQGQKNLAEADRASAEADRIRGLYPAQKDEIVAMTDYYRDLLKNNDFQRRLAQSNIDLNEAERGIKARQDAILAAQEKYADKYYDLVNKSIQYHNALENAEAAGKRVENRFLRRTLQNRIDTVDYELKNLIITAGINAKDYNTYEKRRVQSWIETGSKVATAAAAGAGALYAGKKFRGMGAPTVVSSPMYNVQPPSLTIDPELLRNPGYRLF